MATSLAISNSDSMKLKGLPAQLTSSHADPQPKELPLPSNVETSAPVAGIEPLESEQTQLASPFAARSYGPSSSSSLPSSFVVDVKLQRQTHTGGPRHTLMSPVRLTCIGSTQQRQPKRPGLDSGLWVAQSQLATFQAPMNLFIRRKINLEYLLMRSKRSLCRTRTSKNCSKHHNLRLLIRILWLHP